MLIYLKHHKLFIGSIALLTFGLCSTEQSTTWLKIIIAALVVVLILFDWLIWEQAKQLNSVLELLSDYAQFVSYTFKEITRPFNGIE